MAIYLHKLLSGVSLELRVRRHSNTRKVSMRFYENIIRMTVPKSLSASKINAFLKEHDQWLEKQLRNEKELLASAPLQLPIDLNSAVLFPYFGEMVPFSIKPEAASRLNYLDSTLTYAVPPHFLVDSRSVRAELMQLLQLNLLEIIRPLIDKWTKHLGVKNTGLKFNRAKGRWGSCTSSGKLRFNWRLIFTPEFVIEAIVIHEVCHLVELNHGEKFKALERDCNPRVDESNLWLREKGWLVLTLDL